MLDTIQVWGYNSEEKEAKLFSSFMFILVEYTDNKQMTK